MTNHVDFRPNTQDEFIWNEVHTNNCYKLPDDMSGIAVIDVGANIGAFAVACLERGCDYVICYEPDKENYDILRFNLDQFDVRRWSIVNAAIVGNNPQEFRGYYLSESYIVNGTIATGSRRLVPGLNDESVDLISIEDVGPLVITPSEIWVKLDCEGCEHQIISSDVNWNRVTRIIGEVHSCSDGITSLHADKIDLPIWYFGSLDGSARAFVGHLMSLGYQVDIEKNPDDERLFLFFANRKQNQDKDVEEFNREFAEMNERFYESLEDAKNGKNLRDKLVSENRNNVTIITPFRNTRKYLRLYFDQLSDLKSTLSQNGFNLHQLIACEGDSKDGTRERLIELSNEYNISLNLIDTTHGHIKWSSVEDPIRMRVMSDVMNKGFNAIDDKTDIVVWIMSDLEWTVADVFGLILTVKQDENSIYAPCVFVGENENKQFYDTWAFRWQDDGRFTGKESEWLDTSEEILELNSAGTCLAMPKKIASTCRAHNNEAVSFCENAIQEGYSVRLLPWLSVNHAPEMKYKILWIGDAICPSGFGRVTHSIVPLLTEMGCEVDIIGRNYFGEPHDFPYRIWPANVDGLYPGGEARAKILVASNKYDVIINLCDPWDVRGLTRELEDLKDNHKINVPLLINWLTVDGKNNDKDCLDNSLDNVVNISCTQFGKDQLGLTSEVCSFGVDRGIFKPLDKVECRKVVASVAPENAFIFGTVCVNQQRKRLDLLLREFSLFVKNCDNSDNIFLYLCISHTDRENGYDLKKLVDYYGLNGKVFVNRSELPDELLAMVYNSFDVFISITQGEGFGLCALEAMACGAPCILSDNSGYSSWVDNAALMVDCDEEIVTTPFNRMSYIVGSVPSVGKVETGMKIMYGNLDLAKEYSNGEGILKANSLSWQNSADILMSHIYSSKDLSK